MEENVLSCQNILIRNKLINVLFCSFLFLSDAKNYDFVITIRPKQIPISLSRLAERSFIYFKRLKQATQLNIELLISRKENKVCQLQNQISIYTSLFNLFN